MREKLSSKEIKMKQTFFLVGVLLNITLLQAMPSPSNSIDSNKQFYQKVSFGCGCGGGGGEVANDELPSDD
jgi:hypothetical protein